MIDLTPLDVRKKKGDFRRSVRGYDPELVDDFLDMVAERLEELVKQNVALTERAEHLQEQVASFREREKALNEALVTAQQLRTDAQAQADREAELVRREAQSQAERIIEEGQRSARELQRDIEALHARRRQFIRAFRTLIDRYLSELEVEEARLSEISSDAGPARTSASPGPEADADRVEPEGPSGEADSGDAPAQDEESEKAQKEWLSSLVLEGDQKDQDS
ncbi:MAG: DivIVA domain-containing protein [Gemmatimonadetes bacterium]|uniref:DivIVA domain-containing protein n=1 Tax=Candidatus Kutchimonas denitrificans TaxID=3056748 RepID=A0AAE4ZBL2_9BACT|nr:DivIVA domain-containing protein [Gemmatimonadota bacterium]NIR74515.1 DivIVA domain-containing protein [Candidatus Kutchimonas denitrificans]NIS02705.1 DivIVA domain-containing protein [Gemmatimonadota bacterium]NIT68866.1 DivIVA domain-containing protein [Gemmatimonadota bacterium]NIU52171.1 DivIVA domain-containing protein [Gemmatimonadota bacterium]